MKEKNCQAKYEHIFAAFLLHYRYSAFDCRTGGTQGKGIQDRRNAGQEGRRTGGMKDRRDAGQVGCRNGGMQDRWDRIRVIFYNGLFYTGFFINIFFY